MSASKLFKEVEKVPSQFVDISNSHPAMSEVCCVGMMVEDVFSSELVRVLAPKPLDDGLRDAVLKFKHELFLMNSKTQDINNIPAEFLMGNVYAGIDQAVRDSMNASIPLEKQLFEFRKYQDNSPSTQDTGVHLKNMVMRRVKAHSDKDLSQALAERLNVNIPMVLRHLKDQGIDQPDLVEAASACKQRIRQLGLDQNNDMKV